MKTILFILTLSMTVARGQTNLVISFTNVSGIFVSNAEVVQIFPNKIIYRTETGGGLIQITNLPTDIQELLGFDPVKAAAADASDAQKRRVDRQHQNLLQLNSEQASVRNERMQTVMAKKATLYGEVIQKLDEGLLVNILDPHNLDTVVTILLKGYSREKTVANGDQIHVTAYPTGLFDYITVAKAKATVHVWTCDFTEAFDFYYPHGQSPAAPISHAQSDTNVTADLEQK